MKAYHFRWIMFIRDFSSYINILSSCKNPAEDATTDGKGIQGNDK